MNNHATLRAAQNKQHQNKTTRVYPRSRPGHLQAGPWVQGSFFYFAFQNYIFAPHIFGKRTHSKSIVKGPFESWQGPIMVRVPTRQGPGTDSSPFLAGPGAYSSSALAGARSWLELRQTGCRGPVPKELCLDRAQF